MATKKSGRKPRSKSAKRTVVVVGKSHRKTRRKSSVGSTHHKPRKKRRSHIGGTTSNLKQIAMMAVGVAAGAGLTHIVLRPVEKHLTDKWPMVGKFLAAGEVFLGGMVALKGKGDFIKSVGVGILAGGVHGLMKQAKIYKNIPGLMIGESDFSEIRVPISGDFTNMLSGLLNDSRRWVRTETVAGISGLDESMVVANTENIAGDWEDIEDSVQFVKS